MVEFEIPKGKYLVRASIMKGAPMEIDEPIIFPVIIKCTNDWRQERE